MKLFFSILICLATTFSVSANSDYQYSIKQLSIPDGIASFTINSMTKSQKGVLWLATNNGVNRVYGTNIDHYSITTASGNENRIVKHIFCDKMGVIWAISRYNVSRYDSMSNSFVEVKAENGGSFNALSFSLVDDGILFGSSNKIYKYLYANSQIELIFSSKESGTMFYYGVAQLDNSKIITSNNALGLFCINPQDSTIHPIYKNNDKIIANGVYIDKKQRLWVPRVGKGLDIYTFEGNKPKLTKRITSKNSALTNDTVTKLLESGDEMWATTDGGGVNIINLNSYIVSQPNIKPNVASQFLKSARSILSDGDNWYIGTTKGGLLALRKSYFNNYRVNPYNNILGPSFPVILSCINYKDRIWLGTDGGGVNIFDPISETFEVVESTSDMKITNLIDLDSEYFMLTAYNEGVFKLHKKSLKLTPIESANRLTGKSTINKLKKIGHSRVLILGWERLIYNIDTEEVTKIPDHPRNISFLEFAYSCDPSTEIAYSDSNIFKISTTPEISLQSIYESSIDIDDVVVDNSGHVWFCDEEGLKLLDPSFNGETTYKHSLRSTANTVLCDEENRIWIGSAKGVSCYDINTSTFNVWGDSDDVLIADFLTSSNTITESGDIYFGGIEGLLRIKNNIPLQSQNQTELGIISVEIDNNYHPLTEVDSEKLPIIKAPAKYTDITLKMITDDQNIFENYNATYTIKTLFNTTTIVCFNNTLSIPRLPSGRYKIEVTQSNNIESRAIATLIIPRPLLLRWWAIATYIITIAALLMWIYFYTIARKRRELMWIMSNNEKQLADEKIRFFINLSHELRTPLTLIHAPIKRLLGDRSLSEEAKDSLQRVLTQANHTFNLVNMVLDIRKLEVDKDTLSMSSIEVNGWIRAIVSEFEYEFKAHGIEITTELEDNLPPLTLDADKCRSVLSNILMNAQKYATGQGVLIVRSERIDSLIRISVIDEWAGVDPKIIDSLFSRFYQSKNSNVGYGIGLSYSKDIIERHNGHIGVKNNETKGATFYFDIPITSAQSNVTALTVDVESSEQPPMEIFDTSNSSILIVDDNRDIINMLHEVLSPLFKKVYCAGNGADALDILHQHKPDIVVSDIMMPIMNGFELCKSLKTDIEISHIPIILLTARADAQSNITGYKMGADNYITKPFDSDLLLLAISNELRKRVEVQQRIKSHNLNIDIAADLNNNADYKLIEQLNEFIITNLSNEDLSLDMILHHIGMSRTSFKNKFFAITNSNINISQYINNFRIERAKVLLTTTNLSISEIAYLVGFSSVAYFGTIFRRSTGFTPRVFKDQN